MHGPTDDDPDPCQSTPKPTPILTVKAVSVMNIMAERKGCSLIADLRLTGEHKQNQLFELDMLEVN